MENQADFKLIKERLRSCEDGVPGPRLGRDESHTSIAGFRVIDVAENCIRKVKERRCRYVALSYVWGGVQQLLLQKANREELERANSLTKYERLIPQTIKDAITLTLQIGERYLWVDSLCIFQDEEVSNFTQLTSMGRIYGEAILTVANAAGTSADADIPGVRPGTRSLRQHVEVIQGAHFSNTLKDVVRLVQQTKWNQRAWTYQEQALSNRLLVILDHGMYFACDHDIFPEDCSCTHSALSTSNSSTFKCPVQYASDNNLLYDNVYAYSYDLTRYTKRSMTYQSDMLRAFSGILAALRPLFRGEFIYGLPETELDLALLWRPSGMLSRNVDPATGKALFPSWSWAGWVISGGVRLETDHQPRSRVMWKVFGASEGPNKYFSSTQCRSPLADKAAFATKWVACGGSYYEDGHLDILFQHPIAPAEERIARQWLRTPDSHNLEFRTLAAVFCINGLHTWRLKSNGEHLCSQGNCQVHVFDTDGHIVGEVHVPGRMLQTMKPGKYEFILLSRSNSALSHTYSAPFASHDVPDNFPITFDESDRFVAVPETNSSAEEEQAAESEIHAQTFSCPYSSWEDAKYVFDKNHFNTENECCIYHVMLVEWTDGVAYRVGVGRVHIDAFFEAKPQWKHVILG